MGLKKFKILEFHAAHTANIPDIKNVQYLNFQITKSNLLLTITYLWTNHVDLSWEG